MERIGERSESKATRELRNNNNQDSRRGKRNNNKKKKEKEGKEEAKGIALIYTHGIGHKSKHR